MEVLIYRSSRGPDIPGGKEGRSCCFGLVAFLAFVRCSPPIASAITPPLTSPLRSRRIACRSGGSFKTSTTSLPLRNTFIQPPCADDRPPCTARTRCARRAPRRRRSLRTPLLRPPPPRLEGCLGEAALVSLRLPFLISCAREYDWQSILSRFWILAHQPLALFFTPTMPSF